MYTNTNFIDYHKNLFAHSSDTYCFLNTSIFFPKHRHILQNKTISISIRYKILYKFTTKNPTVEGTEASPWTASLPMADT